MFFYLTFKSFVMKNILKNYTMVLLLMTLLTGCSQKPSIDDKANAEAAIKGFYTALENMDYEKIKTYCAPDFSTFEDGYMSNNIDDFITIVKSFGFNSMKVDMDFVKTDVTRDMAHSIVKFDAQFKGPKNNVDMQTYENYILKKIDGKWLISFFHSSHLNTPPRLDKGSILGMHLMTNIKLQPGVTMEQAVDFMNNKYSTALNKAGLEVKVIPLKGLRGDAKDTYGYIYFFNSDEVRNSLWSAEGVLTPKGDEMMKKIQTYVDEQAKLFTFTKDPYTDWEVQ